MNLKIIEETKLGFEHSVDVTYTAPILKTKYSVRLLLILALKTEASEVIDYMIRGRKKRDIIHHSILIYEHENNL